MGAREIRQAALEFRKAGCEGKERFESFELAKKVATRYGRKADRRMAYQCHYCGFFHVGTRPVRRPKSRPYQREDDAH